MKNLVWVLVLFVGGLKAQTINPQLFPHDRQVSGFTSIAAASVSYVLTYSLLSEKGKMKKIHTKSTLVSLGTALITSVAVSHFLENNWDISADNTGYSNKNIRQNITVGLVSSSVSITLFRIGIN